MPEKSFLEKLQASFPTHTKRDWTTVASTEVNGKDALDTLYWEASDIKSKFFPYYDVSDLQQLADQDGYDFCPAKNSFLGARTWHALPYVVINDEKNANTISHNHVMRGADGILFDNGEKDISIEKLLENIEWPYCHLSFINPDDFSFVKKIAGHCLSKSYSPGEINGSIFWKKNPLLPEAAFQELNDFRNLFTLGIFLEPAQPVDQISIALLRGVELICSQINKKELIENAVRRISFSISVGNNFLFEIAKLKALRMLWYQVTQAFEFTSYDVNDLHIHARCEPWIAETFQPHGNMLKSTTGSISAICGGCNSLTIMSETYGNTVMERMARNISVILREESHLNKVADPVAGSYAVESMTRELAREAWQRFQFATR